MSVCEGREFPPEWSNSEREYQREHEQEMAKINYHPTPIEAWAETVKVVVVAVVVGAVAALFLLLKYGVLG